MSTDSLRLASLNSERQTSTGSSRKYSIESYESIDSTRKQSFDGTVQCDHRDAVVCCCLT